MKPFLLLLAFLANAGLPAQHVVIAVPGGATLDAALVRPDGPPHGHAVAALHGCAGPLAARDGSWTEMLVRAGHIVLLPDSFGSRGLGPQCRVKDRPINEHHDRRADAIAAAEWLEHRSGTPPGGVDLLGWSNGGGTVLYTARTAADLPPGLFRRFVAFYPGCKSIMADAGWRPVAHVTIFQGEADDWTPAPPCHEFASEHPNDVTLIAYPGAYHDFDAPNRPVVVRGKMRCPAFPLCWSSRKTADHIKKRRTLGEGVRRRELALRRVIGCVSESQ